MASERTRCRVCVLAESALVAVFQSDQSCLWNSLQCRLSHDILERMFDIMGDGELIDVITSSQRTEAQATSRRLSAIGVLVDRHADPRREDPRDRFAVDRWDEVAAQVAAAQGITHALASSQLRYAYVLRHRLRAVADRFASGDVDFRTVAVIVGRTELLEDDTVVAAVDAAIVAALPRWERWSIKRIASALDALIYRHDRDAVRRTKTATDDRHLEIHPSIPAIRWPRSGVCCRPHMRSHSTSVSSSW